MTTCDKVCSKWIKLPGLPDDFSIGSVLSINEHEFIATSRYHSNGIYKYNMNKDEFLRFFKYSAQWLVFHTHAAINQMEQEVYLYSAYSGNIRILNLQTNEYHFHTFSGDSDSNFLFINNHFHIINNYNKHAIVNYKQNTQTLDIISDTLQSEDSTSLSSQSVIYIPSKQSILLLGGTDEEDTLTKELWIYSLKTQKWKMINNVIFEGYWFSAVLSSNEQYIILFGGQNDSKKYDDPVDDIFVLDIKDDNAFKLKKSTMRCPQPGECHGVRTGGINSKSDILVIGFIKKCFKENELKNIQLPPLYIMKLIANWYSMEMIHWISKGGNEHYCIKLKDILSTTS
eukprot:351279_1